MSRRRFCIGVDLGKSRDPSAIAVVEAPPGADRYEVSYLERLPLGMDYTTVTQRIYDLSQKLFHVDPELVVDAGAAGVAIIDSLRKRDVRAVISVQMVAGEAATKKAQMGDHENWTVSRALLLRGLSSAVYARKLRLAPMPEAKQLQEELGDLELRIMPSGAQRVEVPDVASVQHHADLAVATALALWRLSTPRPVIETGYIDTFSR